MMLGVSERHFWDSTPNELQPYVKMDKMMQDRLDAQMWQMGLYVNNAVFTAVHKALAGSKSHAEYMDKPITQVHKEQTKKSDFARFSAWAVEFNTRFENGQAK